MKRVGLTQRVEIVTSYGERRDCLDQSWAKLLVNLGYLPVLLPNMTDERAVNQCLKELSLSGVILTGGNDLVCTQGESMAEERDFFETQLISYCIKNNLPILGVCRGMQMLNIYFGGTIKSITGHVCDDHQVTFRDGQKVHVNSYHNWGMREQDLAPEWQVLGFAEDGVVEYAQHKNLLISAIMWHPERHNKDAEIGHSIIKDLFL